MAFKAPSGAFFWSELWVLQKVGSPVSYYIRHTEPEHTTEYVVVSAVNAPYSGAETFIFPADEDGNVLSWAELEGSCRGDYTHEQALEEAGYKLIE
jgi:hypothetical protein